MKQIKNLMKLTNLNSERLNEKELSHTIGGFITCFCLCYYEGCGGESKIDNGATNKADGLFPPKPITPGHSGGGDYWV